MSSEHLGDPSPAQEGGPENTAQRSWGSHLFGEVIMGHLHSQKRLVDGRPGEAVLKQEAMLVGNEEGQNPHVRLGERGKVVFWFYSGNILFHFVSNSHFHCWGTDRKERMSAL